MRVVAGTAKGRRLKTVPGETTRPITDRVKVALFDIISGDMQGSAFLDLFAGTGGVGIEALSRGAREAVFVDIDPDAIRILRENLKSTLLEDKAVVVRSDSFSFLERRERRPFDIIYVAPPQYRSLWIRALQSIDSRPDWLAPDGMVVVQIDPKEAQAVAVANLSEFDRRRYGSTLLLFFEKPGE
jgi:16S rRNA (guanine(966)-N(2))-methyltransferase RsmD